MDWNLVGGGLIILCFGVWSGYAIAMYGRTMYNAYVARTKMMKEAAKEGITIYIRGKL